MKPNVLILIVDDEPDIRRIVHILLENKGYCVLEAENGAAAVEAAKAHPQLDLVILDIMMPQLSGFDAARQLREITAAPILFLTARTQERDRTLAYDAGGDDYLAKPFSRSELIRKVDSLLRRYRVYRGKPEAALPSLPALDPKSRCALWKNESVELTDKEYEILRFLLAHRGAVVSVEQLYEGAWHEKYMASSANTVMVHIVNLRKKLEADPGEPQIIRTVWGKGYQIDA